MTKLPYLFPFRHEHLACFWTQPDLCSKIFYRWEIQNKEIGCLTWLQCCSQADKPRVFLHMTKMSTYIHSNTGFTNFARNMNNRRILSSWIKYPHKISVWDIQMELNCWCRLRHLPQRCVNWSSLQADVFDNICPAFSLPWTYWYAKEFRWFVWIGKRGSWAERHEWRYQYLHQ